MTDAVAVLAPAKLNLFLHVGEKRADGYHALESLVVFAESADRLTLTRADAFALSISGPFATRVPKGETNLALKAARALATHAGRPLGAEIALEKNLPAEAGIGGGSADAAAVLRGLDVLWDLHLGEAALVEIAAGLGSDVPACVLSRSCWMEGRGERVTPIDPLPQFSLVLVNPGVAVPTRDIFAALNVRSGLGAIGRPPAIATHWDLLRYLDAAQNDLETPAAHYAPLIEEALDALAHEPGCVLAQMSGSGATCFGLFQDGPWAEGAARRLAADHRPWWVQATRLAAADIGKAERSGA